MSKFAQFEEEILKHWQDNDIFAKQLEKHSGKQKFTYYDGPPFATGLPHYGHIVASVLKDVVPRYWAMRGYDVPRKWCWDVHGLPIEFEIEKKLGIKTKDEVLKMGIDKYNEECRSIVMTYSTEWKKTIARIGRWVDMENNIKTMDTNYMNKVWQIFHQLFQKNLVYEGVKVMPYSTGCNTPLSNFEAKSNYKKVNDPSLTVKFSLNSDTFILVWTTTPWTLPSNMALCVHPDLEYVKVDVDGVYYILAKNALKRYKFTDRQVVERYKGKDMIGWQYTPLYPIEYRSSRCMQNYYKIVSDDYVKADNGTGIVHQAPAFGEDDYRVCLEQGIIDKKETPYCPFDANGYFTELEMVKGMYFKDADKVILKDLKKRNCVHELKYEAHEYPFCWRSNTPLMYRIVPCTFINVEAIKEDMIKNNRNTHWTPDYLRDGRFGRWLEEARDWCVSRNRFWGTPIPIWKSTDGDMICVSSKEELEQLAGLQEGTIEDMHRHHIDEISFQRDGKTYKRIEEVFDCWFESGSLPFASQDYPDDFNFPADYIAEGIDQCRGWFYTLMVIGTAIKNCSPFKNVIVNGLVLAEDGEKMSKSKRNYPDPMEVVNKYGADALRLYLISTQVVKGEALKFRESGVNNVIKQVHQFAYNTVTFLEQMIPLYVQNYGKFRFYNFEDGVKITNDMDVMILNYMQQFVDNGEFRFYNFEDGIKITNGMDVMILNYLQQFVDKIHGDMRAYNLSFIGETIEKFIGQVSRTYLNMNKSRLKCQQGKKDAKDSLNTLFYTMKTFSKMLAPFAPFLADKIFLQLCNLEGIKNESVHLEILPIDVWRNSDSTIGQEGIALIEQIIGARNELRTILQSAKKPVLHQTIYLRNNDLIPVLEDVKEILQKECNTITIDVSDNYKQFVKQSFEINMPSLGKKFRKHAILIANYLKEFLPQNLGLLGSDFSVMLEGDVYEISGEDVIMKDELEIETENHIKVQFYEMEGILVMSDLTWNDELERKYNIRVIAREIMAGRKAMGLVPTDCAVLRVINGDIVKENEQIFREQIGMEIVENEPENYVGEYVVNVMDCSFIIYKMDGNYQG